MITVSGGLCATLGATVVAGWHTQALALIQIRPEFTPMVYNTGLSFVMAGSAMSLLARSGRAFALAVGPMAFTTLYLSLIAPLGFLARLPAASGWGQFTRTVLHAASGFTGLSSGILAWAWGKNPKPARRRWLPIPAGVGLLTVVLVLHHAQVVRERIQMSRSTALVAKDIGEEIEMQVQTRIMALARMAGGWEIRGKPGQGEWEAEAALNLKDFGGYQAIEWLDPSCKVRWVVPLKGNEAILNRNLPSEERRRKALEAARERRAVTLTPPLELVQGGKGFVANVPIFRKGTFEGFVLGVFRFRDLLAPVLRDVSDGYAVAVLVGGEEASSDAGVPPRERIGEVQEADVSFYGVTWRLRVWPRPDLVEKARTNLPAAILIVGVLMSSLLTAALAFAQAARSRAREVEEVQERTRLILETSLDAFVAMDAEGRIRDWSAQADSLFGWTRQEAIGRSLADTIIPPQHRKAHEDGLKRFLSTGEGPMLTRRIETTALRRDGCEFPVELTISPLSVGGTHVFNAFIHDISERRRAEKYTEAQGRMAAFGAEVGVALTQNDPLRNILQHCAEAMVRRLNAAFARIWTLNKAGDVLELQASAGMYTHIDGAHGRVPVGTFEIGLIAAGGEPHLTNTVVGDPRIGDQEWARREGMAAFAGYPLKLEGRIVGVIAMFARQPLDEAILQALASVSDIVAVGIERKQAETALRDSEERYRDLFENASDLIQSVAPDGSFAYVNRAWMETLGYSPEEVARLRVFDTIHPGALEHCTEAFRRVMSGERTDRVVTAFISKNGRKIEVEGSVSCRFVDGAPVATRGIFRDITERKEIDRMKDEFISTVSHELRTPLTSIRGSLGLVAGGVTGKLPPQAVPLIDIALNNCERLVRLINDILDVEKIESGRMDFNLKPLGLASLIEQTIEANRGYGEKFSVRFVLENSLPDVQVKADADRLIQVLTNMLSNAAKFSPPGDAVIISMARKNGRVSVSVTDHGPGIPEEFRGRIFQKFAQADASDSRQKGGTGLGLSISKAIVERHGGVMAFDSEVEKGTTFYFGLPEHNPEPPVTAPAPTDISRRPRVLVCEGDRDVATLLNLMLSREGLGVDVAYSTEEARQLLSQGLYDALTLDLLLSGQDGISLIRELRRQEETRHLPIVVVSARADGGRMQIDGDAIAVIDWATKSMDQERLITAVRQAVRHALGRPRILHVEDDADVLRVVATLLRDLADVVCVTNCQEARQRLEEERFDLMILDLKLSDGSGLELLPLLAEHKPPVPVLVFSATEIESKEASRQIVAALVKSSTSNQKLVDTIRDILRRDTPA